MCQNLDVNPQVSEQISVSSNVSPDHQSKVHSSLLGCSTPDIASISQSSPQSERIKTIKFCFDIIELLPKCQQAIILFSTLFQQLNILKDDNNTSRFTDVTNELLLELLISKIQAIHDREIVLNQNEVNSFLNRMNERNTNSLFKLPVLSNSLNLVQNSGKLRCFCKRLNTNSVLITILPASYKDLKLLISGNPQESIDSSNTFHIIDENLKSDNQCNEDSHFGSLTLPIYIYKASFTALSDQLVYLSDGRLCRNIYLDNTHKSRDNDSFHFPFKTFQPNEFECESPSKSSSLRQFCRTLQMIFWNSVTQTVYRSLQLGYSIDRRDISKIVEYFSDKTFLKIDITKFIIYLCEHLKDYFLKYCLKETNPDINNFLKSSLYSFSEDSSLDVINENANEYKAMKLSELLRITKSCLDIKELHNDIKEKFSQTLQNYFSRIPCFPSYYFFNCKQQIISGNNENNPKLENELIESNFIEKSLTNCTTDDEIVKNEVKTVEKDDKISDDSYSNNFSEHTLKLNPKNETFEESESLTKSISSKVSLNASDDTSSIPNLCDSSKSEISTTNTYLDTSSQPLFLRLSCSIKTESSGIECSLNSLPTCLQEIISSLEDIDSGSYFSIFQIN
jgi:hypothetical protein